MVDNELWFRFLLRLELMTPACPVKNMISTLLVFSFIAIDLFTMMNGSFQDCRTCEASHQFQDARI